MANGKKLLLAVIFGGRSPEHEISLESAANIISALDKAKYDLLLIGITKTGKWICGPEALSALRAGRGDELEEIIFSVNPQSPGIFFINRSKEIIRPDAVIPALHGPFGEDGSLQGLLALSGLPFAGCGVLASAVGMDKAVQKELCRAAGIPVVKSVLVTRKDYFKDKQASLRKASSLSFPVFVKPANMGSSVGVHKVNSLEEIPPSLEDALHYDVKALIECAVPVAREIECAVLGADEPRASILGEIQPSGEFYDYQAKYVDGKSLMMIPAALPEGLVDKIKQMAISAFKALGCSGLSRVDFLLDGRTSEIYLNEINTFPGFTAISMFPKLWEASGLSVSELLDEVVALAVNQGKEKSEITRSYFPEAGT